MKNLPIYDKQTVEFVTVAAEYCGFIERAGETDRREFVDKSVKLLPLLYLKAVLLPPTEYQLDEVTEQVVTEEVYEYVRTSISRLMGRRDDYLEVFADDMQYSENAIPASISEDMADIYQDVKDFVAVYSTGLEGAMNDALARLSENFGDYWGQKLVNVMRQLHMLRFNPAEDDDEDGEGDEYGGSDDAWSGSRMFDNQRSSLPDDAVDNWI
jgi:hypothetical protein